MCGYGFIGLDVNWRVKLIHLGCLALTHHHSLKEIVGVKIHVDGEGACE